MPFLVRYPREIEAGSASEKIVLNTDFAPTFLEYAGVAAPAAMEGHGASARAVLRGEEPAGWRDSMYYRYFMHLDGSHNTYAHYGVRTERHKLIYYYEPEPGPQEWELFDLQEDPKELRNVYGNPAYAEVTRELKTELRRLRQQVGDQTNEWVDESSKRSCSTAPRECFGVRRPIAWATVGVKSSMRMSPCWR